MKGTGSGDIAALAVIRTDDHIGMTVSATGYPDSKFRPLNSVHPGPSEGGLDDFLGNDRGSRFWAVHLQSRLF